MPKQRKKSEVIADLEFLGVDVDETDTVRVLEGELAGAVEFLAAAEEGEDVGPDQADVDEAEAELAAAEEASDDDADDGDAVSDVPEPADGDPEPEPVVLPTRGERLDWDTYVHWREQGWGKSRFNLVTRGDAFLYAEVVKA